MKRMIATLLSLMLLLSGCGSPKPASSEDTGEWSFEGGGIIIEDHDEPGGGASGAYIDQILDEVKGKSKEEQAAYMLDYANQMVDAQTFGIMTDEMITEAKAAVELYPHPLLLNNYATMLMSVQRTREAKQYLEMAIEAEPDNPIYLTNLANVYIGEEDYAAARPYAEAAVRAFPEYGPGMQALTILHLHDGNMELAAETLIKSAANCFDDVTANLFDSLLIGLGNIHPDDGVEFPIKEWVLDELYEMARKNVAFAETNQTVDTPSNQLTIPAYPPDIKNGESLPPMMEDLKEQGDNIMKQMGELKTNWAPGKSYSSEKRVVSEGGVTIPVQKSLRQHYALAVMDAYYGYQEEKISRDIGRPYEIIYENLNRDKSNRRNKLIDEKNACKDKMCDACSLRDMEIVILEYEMSRDLYTMGIEEDRKIYAQCKPLLEEYWLRMNGLLKYVQDEQLFTHWQGMMKGRILALQSGVYARWHYVLDEGGFYYQYLEYLQVKGDMEAQHNAEVDAQRAEIDAQQKQMQEQPVLMEDMALQKFKEPGDIGSFGIKPGAFGFEIGMEYNGEQLTLSLETPVSKHEYSKNFFTGESGTVSAHGVSVAADGSFKLKAPKDLGKTGDKLWKKLGFISIGGGVSRQEGIYNSYDSAGRLTDSGKYVSKDSSFSVHDAEIKKMTVLKQSYKAGSVAYVERSREIGFSFVKQTN